MQRLSIFFFLTALSCLSFWPLPNAAAQSSSGEISAEIRKILSGAPQGSTGLSIVELPSGKPIFELNPAVPLKPASVLKLELSAVALRELGADFNFETEIRSDEIKKGRVDTLVIKGGGDPDLTIESLWLIARRVKKRGIRSIGTLVLDGSAFATQRSRSGARAYETGSSPLAFNFNSVAIDVCPGPSVGAPAVIAADPWESDVKVDGTVKTVAGAVSDIGVAERGDLSYRVSGKIGAKAACATFYRSVPSPEEYLGRTFVNLLKSLGISVERRTISSSSKDDTEQLFVHRSKALSLIIQDLNHFSTNFIAEQVLHQLGGEGSGVLDRARGLEQLNKDLAGRGFDRSEYELFDGCGLSHSNRISARILTALLRGAYGDPVIGPEFVTSLSILGKNGTLKRRESGIGTALLRGKTGTLDGVSSLAGYLNTKKGSAFAFAFLQNGIASKERATSIEDALIRYLNATL